MIYDLQKASMLKRISAWLLDAILLVIIASGFALALSAILDYDGCYDKLEAIYAQYEEEYGIVIGAIESDLTPEELEVYKQASDALQKDEQAIYQYNLLIYMSLSIVTFSLLASFLLLEFAVPLLLKNGQTVGKKIFGIGLMRTDGVKMTAFALFARTVLGKFTIETMLPLMIIFLILMGMMGIVGVIVLLGLLVIQLTLLIRTETNSMIHDSLAATVAVDLSSQMIFPTREDLMAYKNKVQAEKANKSSYF